MAKQICPECGHVVFHYELCCPVCNGNELCIDAGCYAGAAGEDLTGLMEDDPDNLAAY